MEFRKKNQSSNMFVWVVFLAVFVLIGGFLVYQNAKLFQKRSELLRQAKELEAEIARLTKEEVQLQASITENQTLEYQEKVLREQGLYQKLGEQVITILPPKTQTQVQQPPKQKPWWNPFTWFTRD
jgi:cell division protein FtsB